MTQRMIRMRGSSFCLDVSVRRMITQHKEIVKGDVGLEDPPLGPVIIHDDRSDDRFQVLSAGRIVVSGVGSRIQLKLEGITRVR